MNFLGLNRVAILSVLFSFTIILGECIYTIPAGTGGPTDWAEYWADMDGCTYILEGHCPDLDIIIGGDDITLKGANNRKMQVREVVIKSYARNSRLEYLHVKPPCNRKGIYLEEYSSPKEGRESEDTGIHLKVEGERGGTAIYSEGNRNVHYNILFIHPIDGKGILSFGNGFLWLQNCVVDDMIEEAFKIQDHNGTVRLEQCEARNCQQHAEGMPHCAGVNIEDSQFESCYIDVDTYYNDIGFKLVNTSDVTIHSPGNHVHNRVWDLWLDNNFNLRFNEDDFDENKIWWE